MGLVSNVTERHDVPGEDGAWIEFRALSAKQLRKAARARQLDAAELLRAYGGDLMQAMRGVDRGEVEEKLEDRLNAYDAETMLTLGIAGWSYDVPVKEGVGQLDEETERWAMEHVGRMSGIAPESDDDRGNGSISFIGT